MRQLRQGHALKGELSLPGDRLQGQFACVLALLAQDATHLHHWTTTPEWEDILAFLAKNGAAATPNGDLLTVAALPGLRERTEWALDAELPTPFAMAFIALLAGLSRPSRAMTVTVPPSLRDRLTPALDALRQGGWDMADASEGESRLAFQGRRVLRKAPSALGLRRTVWTFAALAAGESFEFEELGAPLDLLENVLPCFGLELEVPRTEVTALDDDPEMARRLQKLQRTRPSRTLRIPATLQVPGAEVHLSGDLAVASWAAVSASLRRGSDITLRNVACPAARSALFSCLRKMGADLEFLKKSEARGIPAADLRIRSAQLIGRKFDAGDLPGLAEAAPFLAVAATHADRETVLGGLGDLRQGPVDIIDALAANLRALGLAVGVFPAGLVLRGEDSLLADRLDARGNDTLALALHALAGALPRETALDNEECLDNFCPVLREWETV